MFFQIALLLCIGLSSPAYSDSGSTNAENKEPRERLITLRDYDFVGPDPTLVAWLAARMAALLAPLDLSDLEARAPPEPPARDPLPPARLLQPDYLPSRVKLPQLVNVSLDYAQILDYAEILDESERRASRSPFGSTVDPIPRTGVAPVRGPGVALVPSPGAVLAPGHKGPLVTDPGLLDYEPDANPGPGESARTGPVETRRQSDHWNSKVLELMKHNIYATQRTILEIGDVVKKYEYDPRFRMAYIYSRLDEWKHNLRTLYYAMTVNRGYYYHLRMKRMLWYYENALRRNIDITYSIEHLVFLHSEFIKKMDLIMPTQQRIDMRQAKHMAKKKKRMEQLGLT